MPCAISTKPSSGPAQVHVQVRPLRLLAEALPVGVHVVLQNAVLAIVENDEHDGKSWCAAVHRAWMLYMDEPSPDTAITGRSGHASLTPRAPGKA